ncbi:MAG TPA: DUF2804 domain-containing protein [Polyangiaceae bacterium]|nr:DUF2804 domain-containing protein [Polyangiaceae bacterium]
MRTLRDAPRVLREGGEVHFGSFRGGLPRMDFGPVPKGRLWQATHAKRWIYCAVADEDVFAACAVVSLGYAATAIVFALDRASGTMLVDKSVLGPGPAVSFADDGPGARRASFGLGRTRAEIGDHGMVVDVPSDGASQLPTHFFVEADSAGPPPISAVVPIDGGYANATEKRVRRASGEIVAGGRRFVLDRALVAFDHTSGFLARHTAWRWALALGSTEDGALFAMNLVEGFVGEAECGIWVGDELHPVGEGRFDYSAGDPSRDWRVTTTCGAVDLLFRPAAVHAEDKDMLLVRSKFVQPVGAWQGTVELGGKKHRVSGVPGVTEHQDVLW